MLQIILLILQKYYANITIILHFLKTIEKIKMIVYNKNI